MRNFYLLSKNKWYGRADLDVLIDLLCLLYFYVDVQIEIQNRNKLSWLKLFVAFLCLFIANLVLELEEDQGSCHKSCNQLIILRSKHCSKSVLLFKVLIFMMTRHMLVEGQWCGSQSLS